MQYKVRLGKMRRTLNAFAVALALSIHTHTTIKRVTEKEAVPEFVLNDIEPGYI